MSIGDGSRTRADDRTTRLTLHRKPGLTFVLRRGGEEIRITFPRARRRASTGAVRRPNNRVLIEAPRSWAVSRECRATSRASTDGPKGGGPCIPRTP